jgi:hypothetical protein
MVLTWVPVHLFAGCHRHNGRFAGASAKVGSFSGLNNELLSRLSGKNPFARHPAVARKRPQTSYLLLPILNILVPQVGHTPWVAGLPFFIVISLGFFISFLALHFTQ